MTTWEWWKWLLATPDQIRKAGLDPRDRVHHCGHRFALTTRWARTVGLWGGVQTAKRIMAVAACERPAYENFKLRHRLRTCGREQPSYEHDIHLTAYIAVDQRLVGSKTPGEAAHAATKIWKTDPDANPGMLGVELLLRWTDMKMVLELEGLDIPRFSLLDDTARQLAYARSSQLDIEVPPEAFDVRALG